MIQKLLFKTKVNYSILLYDQFHYDSTFRGEISRVNSIEPDYNFDLSR